MGMDENVAISRELFEELYVAHAPHVLAYVRRRSAPDAVEDVVSETFLTAWRRLDEARRGGRPWLFRTAANVLKNRVRGESRQLRTTAKQASLPAEVTADHADVVVERSWVLEALQELSPIDREALMLAYWEGLDNSELASTLNCSRPVAALRLHRARRRMQRTLDTPDSTRGQYIDSRSKTS